MIPFRTLLPCAILFATLITLPSWAGDVVPDEGCEETCAFDGHCGRAESGACVARSEEECQASEVCYRGGYCFLDEELRRCRGQGDERCLHAGVCAEFGSCTSLPFGTCGTPEESCRMSMGCLDSGQCTWHEATEQCVAASASDCTESNNCQFEGFCGLDEEEMRCVRTADACSNTDLCRGQGLCDLLDERCAATSDGDCRASEVCHAQGRCTARGGTCRASSHEDCAASLSCRSYGACLAVDRTGNPTEDPERVHRCGHGGDCEGSVACREAGACGLGAHGRCVPASEDHCRGSQACQEHGRCTFYPGRSPSDGEELSIGHDLANVAPHCTVGGPEDCEGRCGGEPGCTIIEQAFTQRRCGVPGQLWRGTGLGPMDFGTGIALPPPGTGGLGRQPADEDAGRGGGIGTIGGLGLNPPPADADENADPEDEEDPDD